jgi:hypothetical protein
MAFIIQGEPPAPRPTAGEEAGPEPYG